MMRCENEFVRTVGARNQRRAPKRAALQIKWNLSLRCKSPQKLRVVRDRNNRKLNARGGLNALKFAILRKRRTQRRMPLNNAPKRSPQARIIDHSTKTKADGIIERSARITAQLRGEKYLLLGIRERHGFSRRWLLRDSAKQPGLAHLGNAFLED